MSSEVSIDHYNQQQQQTNINATSTSSSIAVTNVDQPQYYHEPAQYYEVINRYDVPLQQDTQDPSSGTDSSQYDSPQTSTIGFADQAHYFVTQDHQLDYFVTDPTTASSPASPSNLDQNHQINDKDQNPLLNFDYTQFYDCDGDDIKLPHQQR
ncbi:hypothetical protein FF1_011355 [Malus domestica]